MNGLTAACGLALLTLVLSLVLKKDAPAIAFLLTLTAGVLILLQAFQTIGGTAQRPLPVGVDGGQLRLVGGDSLRQLPGLGQQLALPG